MIKLAKDWTDEEINEYYDTHWNITLAELSRMTCKSVEELKKILMNGDNYE